MVSSYQQGRMRTLGCMVANETWMGREAHDDCSFFMSFFKGSISFLFEAYR